jgi:S1-C subfamily serine protease
MRFLCAAAILLSTWTCHANIGPGISLVQVAADDSSAILQIVYWGPDGHDPSAFNVDGTGFLIGREGYFITAAHVLERYKASTGQLSVTVHQRDKSGSGHWFNVIEKDSDHDLALCKLIGFNPRKEPIGGTRPMSSYVPITSLLVSARPAKSGEMIAIIGYPLGSFASPIIQMGNIAATDAMLEAVPNFPAGRHDLLIVSAAGNHGDSGCPVISLETGEVLGMIIEYVPAPLLSITDGKARQDIPQQSGLMVSVPAQWMLQILARHNIANIPLKPLEHLVM